MKTTEQVQIKLSDYQPTGFEINNVDLCFDLYEDRARVTNVIGLTRQKEDQTLFLNGEDLKLVSLKLNSEEYKDFEISDEGLTLKNVPKDFTLEIVTEIHPESNTSCMGLYKSGGIFCTQNEAEGFRKITYFFDRPDMMGVFTTKIIADKKKYPLLLSNGNMIAQGDVGIDRHFVTWSDPYRKPCYLFALVAGDFDVKKDNYVTTSGRNVSLEIYVDKGNLDRCDHAMESLKKSMKWDEDVFGLEYDLDIYMIVAVDSFNMGAMENKGLNIFNSVYVLAKKETATDEEYLGIEGVIGHEYFHNWTGNRVTCRDWFQLTLKEGLTVFRDQEFSSDMFDRTVKRIMDITRLREGQFPEDSGPMSHPIKPKAYMEISNFYTATIYEKGAEVIRMIETLIGRDQFKAGITKYFELFDGQAVRTEDFLLAMEKASGNSLAQFSRWYDYAGTPELKIEAELNKQKLSLKINQIIPSNGNEALTLEPLHIPFVFALNGKKHMIELTTWETEVSYDVTAENLSELVCEWNLDFSAPVFIKDNLGIDNLMNIARSGSHAFSRWNAYQDLLKIDVENFVLKGDDKLTSKIVDLLDVMLRDNLTHAVKAELLRIPSEVEFNNHLKVLEPTLVQNWIDRFYKLTMSVKAELLLNLYNEAFEEGFSLSAQAMGKRMLRGQCLAYMAHEADFGDKVYDHFKKAHNMSDQYRALHALVRAGHGKSEIALSEFYTQWKNDNLVINKWLSLQSIKKDKNILNDLDKLTEDAVFSWNEPNKVRAIFGVFAMRNLSEFHQSSGAGYEWIAKVINKLDKSNPQVAGRLATSFRDTKKLMPMQKQKALNVLVGLKENLQSTDCIEIIGKTIEALKS